MQRSGTHWRVWLAITLVVIAGGCLVSKHWNQNRGPNLRLQTLTDARFQGSFPYELSHEQRGMTYVYWWRKPFALAYHELTSELTRTSEWKPKLEEKKFLFFGMLKDRDPEVMVEVSGYPGRLSPNQVKSRSTDSTTFDASEFTTITIDEQELPEAY